MRARDKANGGAIVGTVNTVIATVKLDPESFRVEGGELRADDAGDGARLDWDSMSQKEEDGLLLFVSTDGTHVREDEIELVDEAGNVTNLERTRDQRGLRCDRCGREIAPSDEDRDDEGKLATPVLCGSCRPERPAMQRTEHAEIRVAGDDVALHLKTATARERLAAFVGDEVGDVLHFTDPFALCEAWEAIHPEDPDPAAPAAAIPAGACGAMHGDHYRCGLPEGHTGDHLGYDARGIVVERWTNLVAAFDERRGTAHRASQLASDALEPAGEAEPAEAGTQFEAERAHRAVNAALRDPAGLTPAAGAPRAVGGLWSAVRRALEVRGTCRTRRGRLRSLSGTRRT